MNFSPIEIENYCKKNSHQDSTLLKEVATFTKDNIEGSAMLSGELVGSILQGIICMIQAKKVLEIGMYTGYSALKMIEVLPLDGTIDTCEIGDNHCKTARSFFNKSDKGHNIKIHKGKALNSIIKFPNESFDFIFIDADKINYLNYYKKSIELVKKSGVIVLDNMLWGGTVINPQDEHSLSIKNTAEYIQNDEKCFNYMIPVRDGLMVCYKI